MPSQPSRRALLAALGLGLAAGLAPACTSEQPPPTPLPPTPDEVARRSAMAAETELAGLARRTSERHPTLTVAAAAASAHQAHAEALSETLVPTQSASESPSGSPAVEAVPSTKAAAAGALAKAERRVARDHRSALAATDVSGDLARLLASVAGSDEAFAAAVTGAGS